MDVPQKGDLQRVIGFWGGVALIVGITIGSGIFRKPPTIAGLVGSPLVIMGLWIAVGVISMCGALAVAELSSALPRTGGIFVYLREAYGDPAAFSFGWLYLLVATPATIGALATVFAEFLQDFLHTQPTPMNSALIATAAIVVLTGINIFGARLGSAVQGLFTLIKVAALAAIILGAFLLGDGSMAHVTGGPVSHEGFARAVASVIWTYDGWIGISLIAGEVVAPERMMKRVIITGMLVIIVLYLGANLAYFFMMPLEAMKNEKAGIARTVMTALAGPVGGRAISLAILASIFGALNGNVLAKPRVSYAMAREKLTFGFLGQPHARWGTPWAATLIQGAAAIALVFVLRDFDKLTTYFVVVEWFALIFAVAAVFVLRARRPDMPRPFRTPGYPWVPLVFVVGTVAGLGAIVWGEIQVKNYSPLYGLIFASLGFPIYYAWRRIAAPVVTSTGGNP